MFTKFKNKGFTLVELIVVIAIIGLMATATLAVLNPFSQFQKSTDARVKSDLSQIQKALETYYEDHNGYPANDINYQIVGSGGVSIVWGSNWSSYMNVVPKDPTAGHKYIYYSPNRQTYYLYANLLRGSVDSQSCSGGSICTNVPAGVNCGSASVVCNFGVSSPNTKP